MSQIDFTYFKGKAVAIVCSADAIIPPWVYMVLAEKFHDNAVSFDFKDIASVEEDLWKENLLKADISSFTGHKVVVRARPDIPPALYMLATSRLKPLVKALMYGEIGMPKVILKLKSRYSGEYQNILYTNESNNIQRSTGKKAFVYLRSTFRLYFGKTERI